MATCYESQPKFKKPPVVETVLGMHFRPLEKLTAARQGIFWEQSLSQDFPELEERLPIEEIQERFDDELETGIRWQVSGRPPTPRLWAKSPDSDSGSHVVQIQQNALLANQLLKQLLWQRKAILKHPE